MREKEFKEWLKKEYTSSSTVSSYFNDCKKVEEELANLDEEFIKDTCSEILKCLDYTLIDYKNNKPAPITCNSDNLVNRMKNYKSAVNSYIRFRKENNISNDVQVIINNINPINNVEIVNGVKNNLFLYSTLDFYENLINKIEINNRILFRDKDIVIIKYGNNIVKFELKQVRQTSDDFCLVKIINKNNGLIDEHMFKLNTEKIQQEILNLNEILARVRNAFQNYIKFDNDNNALENYNILINEVYKKIFNFMNVYL